MLHGSQCVEKRWFCGRTLSLFSRNAVAVWSVSHLQNFPAGFIPSISLIGLPEALPNSKGNRAEADLNLAQLSKVLLLSPLHNAATINFAGISIFEAALN